MTLPHTIKDGSLLPWQVRANFDAVDSTIACRYRHKAGQTITKSNSYYVIDYETKDYDTDNCVTIGSAWKFTCPKSGKYRVTARVYFASALYAAGNRAELIVSINGTAEATIARDNADYAIDKPLGVQGSTVVSLEKGEYLQVEVSNNRAGGDTTLWTGNNDSWICIERVCS